MPNVPDPRIRQQQVARLEQAHREKRYTKLTTPIGKRPVGPRPFNVTKTRGESGQPKRNVFKQALTNYAKQFGSPKVTKR